MRIVFLLSLLLSSRLFASAIPVTHTETLPNGVRIILQEDHSKPKVAVSTLVRTDMFPQKNYGMSHLVQHLLMSGKHANEVIDLAKEVEILTNASFVEDASWFDADMPKSALPAYLKASRKQLGDIDLSVSRLDTCKDQITKETFKQLEESSITSTASILKSKVFEDPSYLFATEGPLEHIKIITPEQANEYYLNNYRSGSITISVVGDFDTKLTLETLRKEWGNFPEKRVDKPAFMFYKLYKPLDQYTVRFKLPGDKSAIALGYEIPDARHNDTAALDILGVLLKEPKGHGSFAESKLKDKVEQTMATKYLTLRPHLFIMAAEGKDKVDVKDLREGLISTLQSIVSKTDNNDWERAKEKQIDRFLTGTADRMDLARNLAQYDLFYGSYYSYYGRVEEYKKVKFHDLQRVIYTYFLSKKPHELIIRRELDPV